jgi:hypothetical protein
MIEMPGPVEVMYAPSISSNIGGPRIMWKSCCFNLDKQFVTFFVQTAMGTGLLAFSAYRLTTEPDCDKASPYWGLIGTLLGFFFNKVSKPVVRAPSDQVQV